MLLRFRQEMAEEPIANANGCVEFLKLLVLEPKRSFGIVLQFEKWWAQSVANTLPGSGPAASCPASFRTLPTAATAGRGFFSEMLTAPCAVIRVASSQR